MKEHLDQDSTGIILLQNFLREFFPGEVSFTSRLNNTIKNEQPEDMIPYKVVHGLGSISMLNVFLKWRPIGQCPGTVVPLPRGGTYFY